MKKGRLEAFSDGVIAIIITIMVLEMKAPPGAEWESLRPVLPIFAAYVMSFVYLGIYWNNHHHMLQTVDRVTGPILWGNLHLLFWLSLIPFATAWLGQNNAAAVPTAVYGIVLLCAAIAYLILQLLIIADQGPQSKLRAAVGWDFKGKLSAVAYSLAIGLAFVSRWVSLALFIFVALLWLVPDRRIERQVTSDHSQN